MTSGEILKEKGKQRKTKMKKSVKITAWTAGILALLCITILMVCNQLVVSNAKGKVFSDIDSIKYSEVGLLLGTTPQARDGGRNYFFVYRIDAAELLYKAGKIEKILISGDEHSLDGVNEPESMRDSLVARGVPADAIILDGKGYRTICSVVNANKVFGLKSFTIISQKFHNERAIYQTEHLGLDVENIQAYNAQMPKSGRACLTSVREYFARVKMFLDILADEQTEYVVTQIPQETLEFGVPTGRNKRKNTKCSPRSFTDKMINDAYLAFINAVGKDDDEVNGAAYQRAIRAEQKCWENWMSCRRKLSQNLPKAQKEVYYECTNQMKRIKLFQVKNQNQGLGMSNDEIYKCMLPDDCSDKALLEYPGFDKVWEKHLKDREWYPMFL